MRKWQSASKLITFSLIIGALGGIASLDHAQQFDYRATVIIAAEPSAHPKVKSSRLLTGMQLAGTRHQDAVYNHKSAATWMAKLDEGGKASGNISISCGSWGSYAIYFLPQLLEHRGQPLYKQELFNNQFTCTADYPTKNPQFQQYDREDFAGIALEKYALTGYLERAAKLISSQKLGHGKVEYMYTFQASDPSFFLEKFEILTQNGNFISGKSWYVPHQSKEFLFSTVARDGFKKIDGHFWPSAITFIHYSKNKVVQTTKFSLVDIKPSRQVTVQNILPNRVAVMDSRLGIGQDVNYRWTGTVPTLDELKRMHSRFGTFYSSMEGFSPEIIFVGVVLIIGGVTSKYIRRRKSATS